MKNYPVCKELSTMNRGSYMSAHVLLNLLNNLGKRDKMCATRFKKIQ